MFAGLIGVFAFVGSYLAYMYYETRRLQPIYYKEEFENAYKQNGLTYPKISDIWISFVAAFAVNIIEYPIKKMVWPYFYQVTKQKDNELMRIL